MTGTWIVDLCKAYEGLDPGELLEIIMDDERCATFGPVHHFAVGAALITCQVNASHMEPPTRSEYLDQQLNELLMRSSSVPGATCAEWGACGAALSVGMAYAITYENGPLKEEGWQEGQQLVAAILNRIAAAGAPRCCKRDSRLAILKSIEYFNDKDCELLSIVNKAPSCKIYETNSVCVEKKCPYYPRTISGGH